MPTYHSGQGGNITVGILTPVGVAEWEFTKTARLGETTNSASGGFAGWKKVLTEASGRLNAPYDTDAMPEGDLGLQEGDEVDLELAIGASGKFYTFLAVIESVQVINNAVNDIVRWVVQFRSNGPITDPVSVVMREGGKKPQTRKPKTTATRSPSAA